MISSAEPQTAVTADSKNRMLYPKMYKVILHNDDHNDMVHVIRSLIKVFGMNEAAATMIMIEAHENGLALCSVEPLERAELHKEQLQALSLASTIEPD
jgi:ATP-dependent Clp protease adaptor protein ClpS